MNLIIDTHLNNFNHPGFSFVVKIKWDDTEKANVPLHFHVLLGEGAVSMNSFVGSGWAKEIRVEDDVPFAAGEKFSMDIICQPDGFNVRHKKAFPVQHAPLRIKVEYFSNDLLYFFTN